MNVKLKVFKALEAEDLEQQVSTFLQTDVASIIKINIDSVKTTKIVDMFEVEVDVYDCFLLYAPKGP
jgi:hypothetical protein